MTHKKIIGLVPPAKMFEDDIPHRDVFLFGNAYVQRIEKQGAIPLGVLSADGHASEDVLSLCDGFLLAGGNKIWPYHLQVVEHAKRTQKPLLGICLGMQAMAAYFQVEKQVRAHGGGTLSQFVQMKKAHFMFNHPVENHYLENVSRETTANSTHPVIVHAGTHLYGAIEKGQANVVSLHSYQVAPVIEGITVSAVAPDGTIEGIECGRMVGVQFHPEVEDQWDGLFAALVQGAWQ